MYCVHCGVKLADTEQTCPLCQTPVFHPDIQRQDAAPLYPKDRVPVHQVTSQGARIITTAVFLLPMLICFQCDLLINSRITWAGYVIGSLLCLYTIFVLPGWFRRPNPVVFLPVSFLVVGLFLCYINLTVEGKWFLSFAFPVVGFLGLLTTTVTALCRYLRRGLLYIIGGGLIALGVFMPLMEFLLCVTFDHIRFFGWSLYPLTSLVIVGGTLIFLAVNRRAREKMERKFFL